MLNTLKKKISTHLNHVFHDGEVEVTIYPTYGFQQGTNWVIPLRGWVHQNRRLPDHLINELAEAVIGCDDAEMSNFSSRFDAFSDDSRSNQAVTIQSDADNEQHSFQISDLTESESIFWFVLVRVTSWIVLVFMDKRNDPRSHTN